MNYKRHIEPDAFIVPMMEMLDINTDDEDLFIKFVQVKADKIDQLWADFLQIESVERLMTRTPTMRTMIRHTSLSNRIKNVMKYNAHIETVGELMQYSVDELQRIQGLGKKSVQEVIDYLVTIVPENKWQRGQ